ASTCTRRSRSPCRHRGRCRCGTARWWSGRGRAGWWRPGCWPGRATGRWCWSAGGQCATASATSAPSTAAALSTRRATTSPAEAAVLAVGHSARDTYAMLLRRGVPMVPKPFQMGVRIEQPQEAVNRVKYGPARLEEKLGAADYSLVARGRHDLFTFCMCAGGQVIPSVSAPGYLSTNGMSLSHRASPYANSGLMVTLVPEDFGGADLFAGMRLQEQYEQKAYAVGRGDYLCPIQRAPDFLARRR